MKYQAVKYLICIFLLGSTAQASNGGGHRRPKRCDNTNLQSQDTHTIDLFFGALLPPNVRQYYAKLQDQIKERAINMEAFFQKCISIKT